MKRLLVLAVLLSAFAIGCTPAPQPISNEGGDTGSGSSNGTTVSNTTSE